MKFIFTALFLITVFFSTAQTYNITGHVKDAQNGEDISGASITVKDKNNKVVTNNYGFYSMSLPKGSYEINCQVANFENYMLT